MPPSVGPLESVERVASSNTVVDFPESLSFFAPYLPYHIKEAIEVEGEAFISRNPGGEISGVFICDGYERTGTIYTRARQVFDYFYGLKKAETVFAELKTGRESEVYDIHWVDFHGLETGHRFRHVVEVVDERNVTEVERFMEATHPGTNKRWVRVAMVNGERCLVIRLADGIAAAGWVSLVNGVGRLHSLFVRPQYRGMGMGEDVLFARLLWLKTRGARSAFSEISRNNFPSLKIASKGQMKVAGQVYRYAAGPEPPQRTASTAKPRKTGQSDG